MVFGIQPFHLGCLEQCSISQRCWSVRERGREEDTRVCAQEAGERERETQTDRQTDGQTDRQTDRERERGGERERESEGGREGGSELV